VAVREPREPPKEVPAQDVPVRESERQSADEWQETIPDLPHSLPDSAAESSSKPGPPASKGVPAMSTGVRRSMHP